MKIKDFRDKNLVFVDVETTGLSPDIHEVIEIACLVASGRDFKELNCYEAKIKPQHLERAQAEALRINGYSPEKWKEVVSGEEAFLKVANIAPNGVLAGWNVSFDWEFLEHNFDRLKIIPKFDYHKIDLPSMVYPELFKMGNITSLSLRAVAPLFEIKLGSIHSAMEDVRATYEIFKKVLGSEIKQESLGI